MLKLCSSEYKADPVQGEAIWFQCLEKIFKHIKIENLSRENVPIGVRDLLNDIVSIILEKLCSQINVDFFISVISLLFLRHSLCISRYYLSTYFPRPIFL
jgi:hypothetical protein